MENKPDNENDEAFGISQIQIIIPDKIKSEETPKKTKSKRKKKRSGGEKAEKNALPHSVVLARCLATALKLVNHHEGQEKQKIKDEEIRQKAMEQKKKMIEERPERFSRVIL